MNIFTIFFLPNFSQNILQNAPNCTIFKNFSRGSMPPNPPSKRVASLRAMQIPRLLQKYFEHPPPPPK